MTTRVSIVEDDKQFREYLAALVKGAPGLACAGAHPSAEAALKHIPFEKPDVLILDLELPGRSGLECIGHLKSRLPRLEILVLTVCDDAKHIFDALKNGATGYLQKPLTSSIELLDAIAEIRRGGSPMSSAIARLVVKTFQKRTAARGAVEALSPRELEILESLSKGLRNAEIARALHLSDHTVSTHLHNIYEKLQVHTRAGATAKFLQR